MDKNCIEIMKNVSKIKPISIIYTTYFENDFLREAQEFYQPKFLSSKPSKPEEVLEYLKIVNFLIKLTNSTL